MLENFTLDSDSSPAPSDIPTIVDHALRLNRIVTYQSVH